MRPRASAGPRLALVVALLFLVLRLIARALLRLAPQLRRAGGNAVPRADAHCQLLVAVTEREARLPEARAETAEEDDRELEAFGGVDRQDAHRVLVVVERGALGVHDALAGATLQPFDEGSQALRLV